MAKDVLISLISIQTTDDDRSETELMTHAEYSHRNGKDIISYEDTEATGFEGSVTTITVDGSRFASVVREGSTTSALYLEKDRKHFCQYETPYGSMQIGVFTHKIANTLGLDGKLYMKYTLDLNSSYLSDNEIILSIQDHDADNRHIRKEDTNGRLN
ncbi:MAG: DUF1934 domain-containing protein [Ruminococcus sp.]|nr:DUF1934 domain-containing protein [Ruminococcus sp.]